MTRRLAIHQLRLSSGVMVSEVPLLLDTGADISLVPRTAVEQIGLQLMAGLQWLGTVAFVVLGSVISVAGLS